jgi:hypothetical protein
MNRFELLSSRFKIQIWIIGYATEQQGTSKSDTKWAVTEPYRIFGVTSEEEEEEEEEKGGAKETILKLCKKMNI